jgi:hypothetical protein
MIYYPFYIDIFHLVKIKISFQEICKYDFETNNNQAIKPLKRNSP